jgi:hypothetical protein
LRTLQVVELIQDCKASMGRVKPASSSTRDHTLSPWWPCTGCFRHSSCSPISSDMPSGGKAVTIHEGGHQKYPLTTLSDQASHDPRSQEPTQMFLLHNLEAPGGCPSM